MKIIVIVAVADLFDAGFRRWVGEWGGAAGFIENILLISFFSAPLFYFFVVRPYRGIAERTASC